MPTIRTAGDRGFLIDLPAATPPGRALLARSLSAEPHAEAAIAGADSILLLHDGRLTREGVERMVSGAEPAARDTEPPRSLSIETSFADDDAPDLPLLLSRAAVSRERFLEEIARTRFRARHLGFLAGFAYLDGLPEEWSLPRRDTPRPRVPAGSLGVAAARAGFYPAATPGGWNLIGRTDAPLWDPHREPPNLISAGDEIAIVVVERPLAAGRGPAPRLVSGESVGVLERAGQRTLVVGAARAQRYAFGLSPGGAFDAEAAAAANRAVGNRSDAALLECAMVGPAIRFARAVRCSWYGAAAEIRAGGAPVADARSFSVARGALLDVGRIGGAMRGWLAIEGGLVDVSPRYAIAPVPLAAGAELLREGSAARVPLVRPLQRAMAHSVRALAGAHDAGAGLLERIAGEVWVVTPALDRTAVKLACDAAPPALPRELPSIGLQFGSVQWHPDGSLVVMGPDHPVTGGYLQPVTIVSADRWKIAAWRPGDSVVFDLVPA
jgi:KipI family sensor histidine kinase inhibitor